MSTQRRTSSNQKPNQTDYSQEEDKDKSKGSFIAVRWPSTLRKALKVAAAASEPPMTMTEYLAECFNKIQYQGGVSKEAPAPDSMIRRSDREQRKLYQELSEKLFKTRDRRLIDLVISLLGYLTRY